MDAQGYDYGAIYYKKYTVDDLPDGEVIIDDLHRMLELYQEYYSAFIGSEFEQWEPSLEEYNPGITKGQWLEMLNDGKTFTENALFACAAMYDFGGMASCKQLALNYGETSDFYRNAMGTQLATKVKNQFNLPYYYDADGDRGVWPIPFVGRNAKSDEPGNFVWKMRPELYEALGEFGIEKYLRKPEEVMDQIEVKDAVNTIKAYIADAGFNYADGMIENFYLSLRSKPFVILAGTSGTGKTRLVKLFAEAINAEYKMVPVRPDWSDSTDLFGHVDLNGEFVKGAVLEFVSEAQKHPQKPYILCLDEMNLARVEYYFSDFLSVIETRDFNDGAITSAALISDEAYGTDDDARSTYGRIIFPENLYVVGTVNMDETTFPFSKKVLDRANTIEFSEVDLRPDFSVFDGENAEKLRLGNDFLKTKYLLLKDCQENPELVMEVCNFLQDMNRTLKQANLHVGYRVRDEIVFYMMNNQETGLLPYDEALDNEIMQKILPRIQGSAISIKEMLCELFKEVTGDHSGLQMDSNNTAAEMFERIRNGNVKYPRSAEKIAFMVRRYEEDGFTSYWL